MDNPLSPNKQIQRSYLETAVSTELSKFKMVLRKNLDSGQQMNYLVSRAMLTIEKFMLLVNENGQ